MMYIIIRHVAGESSAFDDEVVGFGEKSARISGLSADEIKLIHSAIWRLTNWIQHRPSIRSCTGHPKASCRPWTMVVRAEKLSAE
jgi:hypothetical protein